MNDTEFLKQFEQCTLPKENFKHKSHLRIAWLYLSQYSLDEAITRITEGIIRYASSIGASHIYHHTMTLAWVYFVHHAMSSKESDFESFINHHAYLLDKKLPLQYFSTALLESEQARKQWVDPDLKTLCK
jgi:hypothetical protein